jgi:hypothetical protein
LSTLRGFTSFLLTFTIVSTLSAETHCPGNVASLPISIVNGYRIILPVTINHSGPYDFLLDTGSDMSIIGPALAAELNLRTQGAAAVTGPGFQGSASFAELDQIQAGTHAVENPRILVFNLLNLHSVDPRIRGVLGEDFLEHFDMLIDIDHHLVCLDDSTAMRASVKGPHIALLSQMPAAQGAAPRKSLMVTARLSDVAQPVRLKLDSGTNVPFLYTPPTQWR